MAASWREAVGRGLGVRLGTRGPLSAVHGRCGSVRQLSHRSPDRDLVQWTVSYDERSFRSLLTEYLLFEASQHELLMKMCRTLSGVSPAALKPVFAKFCGGETFEDCLPIARDLHLRDRIQVMIDHSSEECQTGDMLDRSALSKIELIEKVHGELAEQSSFVPLKPTSLIHPEALEALTSVLQGVDADSDWDACAAAVSQLDAQRGRLLEEGLQRLREVCRAAQCTHLSLLIDAEQSHRQPAVHVVFSLLAREFNQRRPGRQPLLFNTHQCYLSSSHQALSRDLRGSVQYGLALGIKLVRGAYMGSERARAALLHAASVVHGNKDATDRSYDAAARSLLELIAATSHSALPADAPLPLGLTEVPQEPWLSVMFATHSRASLEAVATHMQRIDERSGALPRSECGAFAGKVHFAQIKGMGDHLTSALARSGYSAHKLLLFGEFDFIVPWLFRRLEENQDGLGAMAHEQRELRRYLRMRLVQ